jgi:glycosyltransferase involved in cell wall biosynthesis
MISKKQVVFVNQSAGYLMIDIIAVFAEVAEERILMTGYLNPRNNALDADVKVEKLATYDRSSSFRRLTTWSLAFVKTLFLIKFKYPKAHLFLVSNPPFISLIPLFCKNTFDLLIYDIYPDALVEFKYFDEKSWIIRKWEQANTKVYSKAQNVYTITEGMKARLSKYIEAEAIRVVPVWTDNHFLQPIMKKQNIFLKKHHLQDKFIVMYSGNMGKSHPVEILVELANRMQDMINLHFLLIGGGDKYRALELRISELKLENISIMPWQPTQDLPFTLSAADLALVTVGPEASDLSIPSKTYNLMSAGVPIICIAPKNSALVKLVLSESLGEVFESNQVDLVEDFIKKHQLQPLLLEKLAENALRASEKYSVENAKQFL